MARKEFDTVASKGPVCVQDTPRIFDRLSGHLHAAEIELHDEN
jgi:hypothetical protein